MPLSPHSFTVFFTIAALCVIFIGIDKSGLGSGLGVLATPLMTMFMYSSKDAIGIILPVLCACDLFALWHYRRVYDRRNVALMLPGSILGILIDQLGRAVGAGVVGDDDFDLAPQPPRRRQHRAQAALNESLAVPVGDQHAEGVRGSRHPCCSLKILGARTALSAWRHRPPPRRHYSQARLRMQKDV